MPSPLTNGHKPRCSQLGIATPTRISQISSSRTGFVEGFFREVCRFWIKTVDRTILVLVVFVRLILLLLLAIF
ncbi:unnamed protein product [Sphagnum jensenii]|uniref:Transmembrane protein n=1 Tax=Sphagnum jensenii TaxID=128206 RepID=A0ABP1ALH6_9BRYO